MSTVVDLAVPVTTQYRGSPYEVRLGKLPCFREDSRANTQGLASLRWMDFLTLGGQAPPALFEEIKQSLRFAMELQTSPVASSGLYLALPKQRIRESLAKLRRTTKLAS